LNNAAGTRLDTPLSTVEIWFNTDMRIKLIGIGQTFRGDDSVGLEVVQRWQSKHPDALPSTLDVSQLESPGLNLLSHMAGYDAVILVDAVMSGSPPGTLHHLRTEDIPAFLDGADSAHGWGIAETIKLGETLQREDFPAHIHLLGIEIKSAAPGQGMSPNIREVVPEAVQRLNGLVQRLSG